MLPKLILLSLVFLYASGVPINSRVTAKVGNAVNIKHPFTTSPAPSKAPGSSEKPSESSKSPESSNKPYESSEKPLVPSESSNPSEPSQNFMTLAPEDARISRIELSFLKSLDHFLKDAYKALHDGVIDIKNHH